MRTKVRLGFVGRFNGVRSEEFIGVFFAGSASVTGCGALAPPTANAFWILSLAFAIWAAVAGGVVADGSVTPAVSRSGSWLVT